MTIEEKLEVIIINNSPELAAEDITKGMKDMCRKAWHASGMKTISFSGYDLDYENRCFDKWLEQNFPKS